MFYAIDGSVVVVTATAVVTRERGGFFFLSGHALFHTGFLVATLMSFSGKWFVVPASFDRRFCRLRSMRYNLQIRQSHYYRWSLR